MGAGVGAGVGGGVGVAGGGVGGVGDTQSLSVMGAPGTPLSQTVVTPAGQGQVNLLVAGTSRMWQFWEPKVEYEYGSAGSGPVNLLPFTEK